MSVLELLDEIFHIQYTGHYKLNGVFAVMILLMHNKLL